MFGQKVVPSRLGGIEVVVKNLAVRMAKKNNEVVLYNRSMPGNQMKKDNLLLNLKIKEVPTINKKGLSALSASFFASVFSSFGKFDVVHIHAEGPALFSWIPKVIGRKKVIVTIHGLDWKRDKWKGGIGSKLIKQGERIAVKFADHIIVLNEQTKQYFMQEYNRDTTVIPNGVNKAIPKEAKIINKKWGLNKDNYLLYLGRIVPEKGLENLIRAFKQTNTSKKLVIAGGASDTNSFLTKMKKLSKNDNRIIFTGPVDGNILEELYSNSYIYILPSRLEGMPLTVLEAMSFGNCVLTSDIPECKDVVKDKGFMFKTDDIDDLKIKINYLLNNYNEVARYRSKAMNYVKSEFNWDEITNKTLSLYRR